MSIFKNTQNLYNIRAGASKWLGQTGTYRGFCKFFMAGCSVRAWFKLIFMSYVNKGIAYLPAAISRFAPFGDGNNNPVAYCDAIRDICRSGMVQDYYVSCTGRYLVSDDLFSIKLTDYAFTDIVVLAYCMHRVEVGLIYPIGYFDTTLINLSVEFSFLKRKLSEYEELKSKNLESLSRNC